MIPVRDLFRFIFFLILCSLSIAITVITKAQCAFILCAISFVVITYMSILSSLGLLTPDKCKKCKNYSKYSCKKNIKIVSEHCEFYNENNIYVPKADGSVIKKIEEAKVEIRAGIFDK